MNNHRGMTVGIGGHFMGDLPRQLVWGASVQEIVVVITDPIPVLGDQAVRMTAPEKTNYLSKEDLGVKVRPFSQRVTD